MINQEQLILNQFSLCDSLQTPTNETGRPIMYRGINIKTNKSVLIKKWPKISNDTSNDLALVWRNEIRALQQLDSLPNGRIFLSSLVDAGANEEAYFLVINSDNLLPLPAVGSDYVAAIARLPRSIFWGNILRLVQGLEILHSQGMIHRNLDEWSILTSISEKPDFKLSGFEWSILIRSTEISVSLSKAKPLQEEVISFFNDWLALIRLIKKLLQVDLSLLDVTTGKYSGVQPLLNSEIIFFRKYSRIENRTNSKMSGEHIVADISNIVNQYVKLDSQHAKSLQLFYGDEHLDLIQEICACTPDLNGSELLEFDLREAILCELRQRQPSDVKYQLIGKQCVYYLKKYGAGEPWFYAAIDHISSRQENKLSLYIRNQKSLSRNQIQFIDKKHNLGNENQLTSYMRWNQVIDVENDRLFPNERTRLRYDAFVFLHLIEALAREAETWTVIVRNREQKGENFYYYTVEIQLDEERENLARKLKLGSLGVPFEDRFLDLIDRHQEDDVDKWQVTQDPQKYRLPDTGNWRYISYEKRRGSKASQFVFSGSEDFYVGQELLLALGNHEKQFRRTTELLIEFKSNLSLTELLSDPFVSLQNSHDKSPEFDSQLDASKREALENIFEKRPFYLLQGPPGVGKTYLVTELVKQVLSSEPSSRMLISAQGHNAVDHIMTEICKEQESRSNVKQPLIIRSRNQNDINKEEPFGIKKQAENLLSEVMNSQLYQDAPSHIQDNLKQVKNKINNSKFGAWMADKAMSSLLLRSANLVFSTTGSRDLKHMVNSKIKFDWNVIEEAGRATGLELLAPLMLSHRHLLIGDPKQLPPFGEDKIRSMLSDSNDLKDAFLLGRSYLRRYDRSFNVDDLFDRFNKLDGQEELFQEIEKTLLLFNTLYKEVTEKQQKAVGASVLTEQYRMHPTICQNVSNLFYKLPGLTTAETISDEFAEGRNRPFVCKDTKKLPSHPIVFVDLPMGHSNNLKFKETSPAYTNHEEAKVIVELLGLLRVKQGLSKAPSLAILTPYNQQVKLLSKEIELAKEKRFAHLDQFDSGDQLVHTIDSFQGNEADIVIVSLVRNNNRAAGKGLGIVGDARRMNVLLSRAKWKLIIVGSRKFLETRFFSKQVPKETDDLHFLYEFNQILSRDEQKKKFPHNEPRKRDIVVVPFGRLKNSRKTRRK